MVLEQESFLHLVGLQSFELVQWDPYYASPLTFLYLLLTSFVQCGQPDVLLAQPHNRKVTRLLEDATSPRLVLAAFPALCQSTLLLLPFRLRQAAVLRPLRPRPNSTGRQFHCQRNFSRDRLVSPGRLPISGAYYIGFGSASLPRRRREPACFFYGLRYGSRSTAGLKGSWIMAIKIWE